MYTTKQGDVDRHTRQAVARRYTHTTLSTEAIIADLATKAADAQSGETAFLRIARNGLLDAGAKRSTIKALDNLIHLIVLAKD